MVTWLHTPWQNIMVAGGWGTVVFHSVVDRTQMQKRFLLALPQRVQSMMVWSYGLEQNIMVGRCGRAWSSLLSRWQA